MIKMSALVFVFPEGEPKGRVLGCLHRGRMDAVEGWLEEWTL